MALSKDDIILKEFGKNLKKIRDSKDLSLRDLEALSYIDHSTIHRIEKGEQNATVTTIVALAKALDIDFNTIFPF